MSLKRRLAAGLPAAGVTALAALAFAGSPAHAYAVGDGAERAKLPSVMDTPCAADARTKCAAPGSDGYGSNGGQADDDTIPNDNATTAGTGDDDATPGTVDDDATPAGTVDDDRGNPGYGGESPAPAPSETTPTGTNDSVPPGGEAPATVPPTTQTTAPGVSAGGTLPLTGAPAGTTIGVGSALVLLGGAAVWYTRRRRSA